MARPAVRIQVVDFGVLVGLALLVGRAAQVQILHGRRWAEEAQAQRTERIVLQARRGTLSDRHGTPLAVTQETYHVGIAPNELRDPVADGSLISRRLGLTAGAWQLALRRRYAYFAGPYSALEVQPLRSVRGVHLEPVLNRFYPDPAVARATIGRLGDDGLGASGLERTLDSLLAGRAGAAVVLKDRAGREYESPARVIAPPVPGLDVVLTLDAELQEIAQRALDDALRRMDADGGDVVMLDPGTGDVLALASRQRDGSAPPCVHRHVRARIPGEDLRRRRVALAAPRVAHRPRVGGGGQMAYAGSHDHRRRPAALAHHGRRDPRLEQHRHRQVRGAAHAGGAVRDAAGLRVWSAHGDRVSRGGHGTPATAVRVDASQRREPRHGLRALGHADPGGDGVRGARKRRSPARAHADS